MALGSAFLLHGSVGGWSRTLFLLAHELPQEVYIFYVLDRSSCLHVDLLQEFVGKILFLIYSCFRLKMQCKSSCWSFNHDITSLQWLLSLTLSIISVISLVIWLILLSAFDLICDYIVALGLIQECTIINSCKELCSFLLLTC